MGMAHEHIVIVSYPRSGSTIIQRVLNKAEGTLVKGETIGAINHLAEFVHLIEDVRRDVAPLLDIPSNDDRNPMYGYGDFNIDVVMDNLRNAFTHGVLAMPEGIHRLGWKENFISPLTLGHQKATKTLQFIQRLLPNTKFIFNVRSPEETAASAVWRTQLNPIDKIAEFKDWIHNVHDSEILGSANTLLLDYDKWNNNPEYLHINLARFGIVIPKEDVKIVLDEQLTHLDNW
jgi:hypothetical protein